MSGAHFPFPPIYVKLIVVGPHFKSGRGEKGGCCDFGNKSILWSDKDKENFSA